jgi:hypothetical protein
MDGKKEYNDNLKKIILNRSIRDLSLFEIIIKVKKPHSTDN